MGRVYAKIQHICNGGKLIEIAIVVEDCRNYYNLSSKIWSKEETNIVRHKRI